MAARPVAELPELAGADELAEVIDLHAGESCRPEPPPGSLLARGRLIRPGRDNYVRIVLWSVYGHPRCLERPNRVLCLGKLGCQHLGACLPGSRSL
jgi:hypothetical protein